MPPDVQPRRVSWWIKAVILASPIPNTLSFLSVTPVLPKMSAALAHNPSQAFEVKMVLGIVGLSMVVGATLGGVLADKVSRRLTFTLSALLFAASGATPFLTENLSLILATRLLMALAAMVCYILGAALVADCFAGVDRARWMGISVGVAVVGGLGALFLAGVLGDIGWHWAFLNYLVGVPIAILSWVGLRNAPAPPGARPAVSAPAERAPFPYWLAVLGLMIGIVQYAPSVYIPFRLTALGVLKPSLLGDTLLIGMAATAVTAALYGRLRKMMSPNMTFFWCFLVLGAGLCTVSLASSYPIAVLGLVVMGAGIGPLVPNVITAAADAVAEAVRGRVIGIVKMCYSIAPAIGITALEPVVRRVGPAGVILLVAAICGLTALAIAAAGLCSQTSVAPVPGPAE